MPALLLSLLVAQVSVDARDARLADVFADLARQSGEAFELDAALRDAKVTVALKGAPVLEAADAVCRAHGGCRLVAPLYGGAFLVAPGPASTAPAATCGAMRLRLAGARATRTTDFHGTRHDQLALDFHLLWERRAAPGALRIRASDASDDTGASLLRADDPELVRTAGRPAQIHAGTLVLRHPLAAAKRLSKLVVDVEAWTAGASTDIAVGSLAAGAAADFEGGRAALTRASRSGAAWTGVLEVTFPKPDDGAPLAPADRLASVALTGPDGRSHPAAVVTALVRDGRLAVELAAQNLPAGEFTALRARWIRRFEKSDARFALKDVELP